MSWLEVDLRRLAVALTRYYKKPKTIVEKHLLGGDKEEQEKAIKAAEEEVRELALFTA